MSNTKNKTQDEASERVKARARSQSDWIKLIEALRDKPSPVDLQALLDNLALVEDAKTRGILFTTLESQVRGDALKKMVRTSRALADKAAKARTKNGGGKLEKGKSAVDLAPWADKYLVHKGRSYAFREHDGYDEPLHTPLRIRMSMIYPDTPEGGVPAEGVCIEFEDYEGGVVRRSFLRDQALENQSEKTGMIRTLSRSGVGFTQSGIEALRAAIMEGETLEEAGMVFANTGWRGKNFFLNADGTVIGDVNHYVELESPNRNFAPVGSEDEWREAVAVAFSDEVVGNRPHIAATILWSFCSPVIARAEADGMVQALIGPTRTYKTFAELLGASTWGSVANSETIVFTLNATSNFLEEAMVALSGIGIFLDDTSQVKAKVVGPMVCDLVFRVAGNTERGRWRENQRRFRLAATISSETGIDQLMALSEHDAPRGLKSRLLEVSTGEPIPDAEHPDATGKRLSDDVCSRMAQAFRNTGHAGPAFVRAMLDGGWTREKIEAAVSERVSELNGKTEQERSASRAVAVMWIAGEIAQSAGLVPEGFDVEGFVKSLWNASKGENDTARGLVDKVNGALNLAFKNGQISIYSERKGGDALARGGDGIALVREFSYRDAKNDRHFTPAFVIPENALAKVAGMRSSAKEVASELARNGAIIREQKDRLYWQAGRTLAGNVKAYVVRADKVLGDNCDDLIERHVQGRIGMKPDPLTDESIFAAGMKEATQPATTSP